MKENANPIRSSIIIVILLLVIGGLVVFLIIDHRGTTTPSSSLNTGGSAAAPTQNQQLVACQDAAHQKYDPEIAAAMSNGTSQQPVTMGQQALSTCEQEYGSN